MQRPDTKKMATPQSRLADQSVMLEARLRIHVNDVSVMMNLEASSPPTIDRGTGHKDSNSMLMDGE